MKYTRICLAGSVFTLVLLLSQPAGAFQNEPSDCRGIEWGICCDELKGFSKVSTQSSLDYYTRKNEEMTFGDASLEMVVYVFYEKQFCGAVLNFKSSSNFQIIKTTLYDWYGKGHQANRYEDKYTWSGTDVTITLEYDDITQKGTITYCYKPIYVKKQRAEQRGGR